MWRANRNPNPYTDLDEISHTQSHLSKKGFGAGLTPATSSLALGGLKYLNLKDRFLKTIYKTKNVLLVDN